MAFGTAERTKERVLVELAAIFGQLLVRGGSISIRRAEAEGVSVNPGEETSAQRASESRAEGTTATQRAHRAQRGFARSAP